MNLQQRINLLTKLGNYLVGNKDEWFEKKVIAEQYNPWFTQEFINLSAKNIAENYLQKDKLEKWTEQYQIPENNLNEKTVGVVMAGNIPLVGFHDFLCVFITGHKQRIKLSSKDNILLKHLVNKIIEWNTEVRHYIQFEDMLKGCDAYIATGSNNSGRYFEYYFAKYPHIIRQNRTSIAILNGEETKEELSFLSDDIHLYFGLGCRNVTKVYVPENYDFLSLIEVCKKYNYFFDIKKYKNNYDYQLALLLMNKIEYKSSGSLLLVENPVLFSPISVMHYEYYNKVEDIIISLNPDNVQTIIGKNFTSFGKAQSPSLTDYADGVDTIRFLIEK